MRYELRAVLYLVYFIWIVIIIAVAAGCAAPHHGGWARAEVTKKDPASQQAALERDREACNKEAAMKPPLYHALMGQWDHELCLERRGWVRVPE